MQIDLATMTMTNAVAALASGELSSVELLEALLDQVEATNGDVNAVVAVDIEGAMAEARAADDALASGRPAGPLHGLPMTVKDTFETAGLTTTAGAPAFDHYEPTSDADVVQALRDAGAIIYGKTNVPFMAGDHQTYNEIYGTTNNPWDLSRTPGGSSGGAAAALAAGYTLGEIGSDIGGSIRVPAHFAGVFGIKPTHGVVSDRGHIPGPPGSLSTTDLAVAGPLGRSVADLRTLLDVVTSVNPFGGVPGAALERPDSPPRLDQLRVGVWSNDPVAPVALGVQGIVESLAEQLAGLGALIDPSIRPGDSDSLHDVYLRLLMPVMLAGLPDASFDALCEDEADGVTASGDRASLLGVARHRDWLGAHEDRARSIAAWDELFSSVDIVLAPVCQTVAPPHNVDRRYHERVTSVDGNERPYGELLFWAGLATMPLLPSVVIPAGMVDGLPCGVQIIGPRWSDYRLLDIAEAICAALDLGFVAPPLQQ